MILATPGRAVNEPGALLGFLVEWKDRTMAETSGGDGAAAGYRLDDQVGFRMRQANQRHLAIFSRHIPDLTPMQFAALAKLSELKRISQNDLGRQTAMDAATMKGVIDRLAKKGLVAGRADPGDRRRRLLTLTPAGAAAYAAHAPAALAITAETLAPLTEPERRRFLKLLAKLAPARGAGAD